MNRLLACLLLVCLFVSQSGCASIVSGKSQDVNIRTTPPGAEVNIDGVPRGTTPLLVNLKRKERHAVEFKKPGYLDEIRHTNKGYNWWFTGNIIFGGIIGIIVDFATGAVYTVKPEDMSVTLSEQ